MVLTEGQNSADNMYRKITDPDFEPLLDLGKLQDS